MTSPRITRRAALKGAAAVIAAPTVFRAHATAAPSETVAVAGFGADGRAFSDFSEMARSKHFKLVAVAEVDLGRIANVKKKFPDVKVYQDWRKLLDEEKNLDAACISTPDHMHAAISLRAMRQGLHCFTQKPLTQTVAESRLMAKVAADKKLVTQMGIQIHSSAEHRTVVAIIQSGAIGKVKEVHSWSGKMWGDKTSRPDRTDPVPANFNWDGWLGVAADRPFIKGYYHPGDWRKRLDFGAGTFGDMGCHILDPVFNSLALTAPKTIQSTGESAHADSWGLETAVTFEFPETKYTTETLTLNWTNGPRRPPEDVLKHLGSRKLNDQGSIYIGTEGVMYSPYIGMPVLLPEEKFKEKKDLPKLPAQDHFVQFVEACRGEDKASAPFSFAGPLTEFVLLGCLATRVPGKKLEWDAAKMTITNDTAANKFVRREYRKGWEIAESL
ncbi:Gfo/Idh/MocA family protein [Limnoglobus roseus]|uniref:Putative Rossmann-fold-type glycoside hydrolase n=1 Tax=Limnoglobus roseus TaxID=2598579 RepID=A0A5C1AEW6_9BACT|nr:Gfo/Idh/MocA family oxidoreductase [Limnoglobus roseus]QEL17085.1 putative Rossmann-fold-type glycoside hydrolase [Limnoglobus roseus]